MTLAAHLTAIAAVLPSLVLLVVLVRRGALRVKYAMLWIPVGMAMIVFAAIPGALDGLAGLVGVAYPPTILFVLSLGLLMFVAIHLSWELSRLDERLRTLAEHVAIIHAEQRDAANERSTTRAS